MYLGEMTRSCLAMVSISIPHSEAIFNLWPTATYNLIRTERPEVYHNKNRADTVVRYKNETYAYSRSYAQGRRMLTSIKMRLRSVTLDVGDGFSFVHILEFVLISYAERGLLNGGILRRRHRWIVHRWGWKMTSYHPQAIK